MIQAEKGQNISIPKNINSCAIIITLEGIEKIKTEEWKTKQSEQLCDYASILAFRNLHYNPLNAPQFPLKW